jgi:hypothetical protein
VGGRHARQVRRPARARDDDLDPARFGALGEVGHPHRRPVRGDDAQAVGEVDAVRPAIALLVETPERGVGHAGDVAADDDLDRQRLRRPRDGDVGIGYVDNVIGHDVACLGKPPGAELVEHLAFVRDQPEDPVKGADAVAGDQHTLVATRVHVTHLALVART